MIDFDIVRPGTTLYIPFATYDSNDPSASVTLTGLAATDIEIYKNGSTTQRSSDNGYTLLDTDGIDFDSVTGIHGFSIDLADNSDAGFYVSGGQYTVVVASVTVDGATVNFIAATFRIGYQNSLIDTTIATLASQTSFTLTAGPAEDNALVGHWAVIHDIASSVQSSSVRISAYTGSTKTVTLAAGATFTAAAGDNISIMGPAPLQPTTPGRNLDVSSGGEAGVDWANVGSPTTTLNLSATTIATLTNERGRYMHGAVWIGPTANTNTTSYVDGIMTNPVSTIAAAKSVADNLGLNRFWVQAGVTVTLGAAYDGYFFDGMGWTLATSGGTRSISGTIIRGAYVSGTYSGASTPYFIDCEFTGATTLPACNVTHCELPSATITLGTGNYDFIDCASIVPGTSAPVVDCNTPGSALNVSFRRWSGGLTLNNINSNTTVSIDVVSGGTITLNGADGNVQVRGHVAGITDNRTGSPTLGQNAAVNITKINTEIDTALVDIHLDHLLAADYDPASKPGVATALLNELVENDGGVSRYTANALEQAPTGGGTAQTGDAYAYLTTNLGALGANATEAGGTGDHLTALNVYSIGGQVVTATTGISFGAYVGGTAAHALASGVIVTTNNDKTGYSLTATTGLGNQTANITGNLSGSVGSIATGGIAAASFAAGAIDAAAIANNAIDAATFAADVDAEILSYVVDDATRIDASSLNTATVTTIPAIVADTNELQTDWVNGGRLDLLVDAIKAATDLLAATATTESYRATNAAGTIVQMLYEILQNLTEFSIASTTKTVKKLDGSTTAKTYTLDSATVPTSITEAT